MVWVLSGVVGGGWFWGAEGLGAERLGFWGVFPNARGGGPVVVVRGPVVFVVVVPSVVVVPWWWCSFGSGGLSWWWRCPW